MKKIFFIFFQNDTCRHVFVKTRGKLLLTREHRSMLAVTSLSAYICFLHNIRATSLSNFTFIHSNTHTLTLALFFFFFLFKSVHFSRIIYEKWTHYKYKYYSYNSNHIISLFFFTSLFHSSLFDADFSLPIFNRHWKKEDRLY